VFSIEFSGDQIIAVLITLSEHTYPTKKKEEEEQCYG
jgi:hypothetical protein